MITPPEDSQARDGLSRRAKRLFLERQSYRRNRLRDGARLLPVLGALLFFAPVFALTPTGLVAGGMAGWILYFFGVWLFVIALTFLLSRALARLDDDDRAQAARGRGDDWSEAR